MLRTVGLLSLFTGLVGCTLSPYKLLPSDPTADLSVSTIADGGSAIGRTVVFLAIANNSCDSDVHGARLFSATSTIMIPLSLNSDTMQIATNDRLHFIAHYYEHRYAEDLDCIFDGNFQPLPGKKYKGLFRVKSDVSSCDFVLQDITSGKNESVPVEKPSEACPSVGFTGEHGYMRANGQGRDVKMKVHVIVQ